MVMAGGGFRFGYYLGIHAALCELQEEPDLLLASCGGAIAAAIIQALPDDAGRKAWIASLEMHEFWRGLKSNRHASLSASLAGAVKRKFFVRGVDVIPDVFNDYLFEIPENLPLPAVPENPKKAVAIIAGKLLFDENEVGQARGKRKLFAETVFCDTRMAALLADMRSPLADAAMGENAISPQLITRQGMPVAAAVRASVSDMFYFRCHSYLSENYIGGVIDLFPIEVARRLSHRLIMERKGLYEGVFALPALRAVLGIDGNQRLRHVLKQPADMWVDTSDMRKALASPQIEKKLAWQRNKIELLAPESYADYLKMIEAQWQYGYRKAMEGNARERQGILGS